MRDNGTNFVLFWSHGMDEDELVILDNNEKNLIDIYLANKTDDAFISNINTNIFMSVKDYFIPYKRHPTPTNIPYHIERMFYQVDFVTFSFNNNVLTIERDENKFKDKIHFKTALECTEQTGLKTFSSHVIIRNSKNKEIFEPLYDVKNKNFYYQGSKAISPVNIFSD